MVQPFISYAREDATAAEQLARDLRLLGANPWLDTAKLRGGEEWRHAISKAIGDCTHFIALLSQRSVDKRGFVQTEVRHALRILEEFPPGDVFLVPVRLEDVTPRHAQLSELHWIDLFPDYGDGIHRLAESLGLPTGPRFKGVMVAASEKSAGGGLEYRTAHAHTRVLDPSGRRAVTENIQTVIASEAGIHTLVTRGISGTGRTANHRANLGPVRVITEGGMLTVYTDSTEPIPTDIESTHVLTYDSIDSYTEPVESFGQNISRYFKEAGIHVYLPKDRPYQWVEGRVVRPGEGERVEVVNLSDDRLRASFVINHAIPGLRMVLRWGW